MRQDARDLGILCGRFQRRLAQQMLLGGGAKTRSQVIAHGCSHYFMRTASVGSNSMPMYMKSGAIPVSQQQDVSSTEQATENHTQSLQRIYLWGDCMASARKIEEIRHQKNYPLLNSQ